MRVRLIAIGEHMPGWVADGLAEYRKRLSQAMPIELVEIRPGRRARHGDASHAAQEEGVALLAQLTRDTQVVVLDGRGKAWSSEDLAAQLGAWRMSGRDLALLVGGADGHAPEVLARADQAWSLGPLTLPHMLVRLLVVEQLYRAHTILAGHPYHRG